MTVEFRLPDVGEGVAEGEIVSWLVEPGDAVTEDQPVAEVETDKAVVEVPSPVNGTVGELRAEAGDVVPVGEVIITFEEEGEGAAVEETAERAAEAPAEETGEAEAAAEVEPPEPAEPEETPQRVFAPPSVRRLARELGVSLPAVEGIGPSGRITESDVRAAAEAAEAEPEAEATESEADEGEPTAPASSETADETAPEPAAGDEVSGAGATVESADRDRTLAVPATRKLASELGIDLDAVPATGEREGEAVVSAAAVREYAEAQQQAQADAAAVRETETADEAVESEPYRGIRRTIGEAMATSKYTAPHVTHHDRLDATELVETRETLKPLAEERGVKLTYLPIVLKAVVAGLKEFPVLNSELREDEERIVYKQSYNIGIATATDAGLMVPVVEDVDEKGLLALATEIRDLVGQARDRSIAREDMQGGTFTITNFGAIGGEYATPIINYPETAILGMGALEQRPMVEGGSLSEPGEVVAKPVLPLSLAIDHRVIDGAEAAGFVNTVMAYLQDPTRLLLD